MTTQCKCDDEKDLGVTSDKYLNLNIYPKNKQTNTECQGEGSENAGNNQTTLILLNYKEIHFIKLYMALVRPHLEYGNTIVLWLP